MEWLWIALFVGAGIAPWLIMGQSLRIGFSRGPIEGFGVWFGVALMTTPAVLLFTWIGVVILR